jgi:hypothetical protein
MLLSCVQNVLKTLPLSVGALWGLAGQCRLSRARAHNLLRIASTGAISQRDAPIRVPPYGSRRGMTTTCFFTAMQGAEHCVSPFELASPLDPGGFEEIERFMELAAAEDGRAPSTGYTAPAQLALQARAVGAADDTLAKLTTEQAACAAAEAAAVLSAEEANCLQLRLATLQHSTLTLQARNAELEAHLDAANSELPAKDALYGMHASFSTRPPCGLSPLCSRAHALIF